MGWPQFSGLRFSRPSIQVIGEDWHEIKPTVSLNFPCKGHFHKTDEPPLVNGVCLVSPCPLNSSQILVKALFLAVGEPFSLSVLVYPLPLSLSLSLWPSSFRANSATILTFEASSKWNYHFTSCPDLMLALKAANLGDMRS